MNSIKTIFSNHLEKTISATKELNYKLNEIIKIGDFLKKKLLKKKKYLYMEMEDPMQMDLILLPN